MFAPNYDKKDRKISGYNAPAPALDISPATVYCSQYMQTKEPEADRSYHHTHRLQFILFFYFSLSEPGNLRVRDNDLFNLFSSFPPPFPHSSKSLLVQGTYRAFILGVEQCVCFMLTTFQTEYFPVLFLNPLISHHHPPFAFSFTGPLSPIPLPFFLPPNPSLPLMTPASQATHLPPHPKAVKKL